MIFSFFKKLNKFKKILLFFVITFFLLSNFTFAETVVKNNSVFWNLFFSLIDLIWAIWYIFPILASKLMTNDLLYWTSLHFDVVLWNIWNFARSMANFVVGFMFIYFVFKYLISFWEKDGWIIKTNLPKLAIASIVINMSWFLMAVLIDFSTILIVWVGSLPAVFWNNLNSQEINIKKTINFNLVPCKPKSDCKRFSYSPKWDTINKSIKDLQTYETMISGPLFFIGSNILWINGESVEKTLNNAYDHDKKAFRNNWEAMKAFIQLWIYLLFLIPIIILIVINIIRVFWIWLYIAFSPLIFLDNIFGWKVWWKTNKAFAFKNMIWLIFQPVLVILSFSIAIIMIVWIYDWLQTMGNKDNSEKVKKIFLLDEKASSGLVKIEFWTSQDPNTSNFIWWFFGYLITSLLVVIILWTLIKISFQASEVTKWVADKMFGFAEDLAKTVPIPTPLWKVSYGSLGYLKQHIDAIPSGMLDKQWERLSKAFNQKPDLKSKQVSDLIPKLKLDKTSNDYKEWIKEAIKLLSWYKWELLWDNAKSLLTELSKVIEDTTISWKPSYSSISTNFKNCKTPEDQIEYISKNQDAILKWLWVD